MEKDASLDDFLDAGDQEADSEAPDEAERKSGDGEPAASADGDLGDAADPVEGDESADFDQSAVEPAVSTLDWTPGGAACETCDEVVERRWRDDGSLVCESCKDW